MVKKPWTRERVEEALLLAQDIVSLNTIVGEGEHGDETELEEFIIDESPGPEELVAREITKENLLIYMQKFLKPREIEVLRMRYGFDTETPMTLEEIGQQLGITRERVRQIEQKAIRRMRVMFMHKNIAKEDI